VIKENINGNARKAINAMFMIFNAKSVNWKLQINERQDERQQSINIFRLGDTGHYKLIWAWVYIIEVLVTVVAKNCNDRLSTPS
jgi:replication-associated recombination protein RarA